MGGTAQDITDLTADDLAAEATRRLELLQQMAMAANQANQPREASGRRRRAPRHTTWSPLAVYAVADGGTPDPRAAPRPAGPTRAPTGPAGGAAGAVAIGPPVRAATHSLVAIPVRWAAGVITVIEVLADEVPPDENSMLLIGQSPHSSAWWPSASTAPTSWPRRATRPWRPRGSSRSSSPP